MNRLVPPAGRHSWRAGLLALVLFLATAPAAFAHEAPEGSEWVMADWMVSTFFLFAGGAALSFLAALKLGLLSNLEDAKYYILEFEEPDYWTPPNSEPDAWEVRRES